MTKYKLLSCLFIFTILGCKLPPVGYFVTNPDIRAYQIESEQNLTVVIDQTILDSFVIKSAGLAKMKVINFRQTISDACINTFKTTYKGVSVDYKYSQKGISLALLKVNPDWNKKSSTTSITVTNGHANSSTSYELESKISYQAILYLDGQKKGVLEGIVYSEKSSFKRRETPDLLKDGIKSLCQEIYKQTINFK
ncbi:MAG: hypothetical protein NTU43_07610 [Bacteroidetes bacterium]|nr:hypothetical protein [Bacteroidota bacterium]